jgi:hypothetical protein
MGTLSKDFFSYDLDFLIEETGKQFTIRRPASLEGVTFFGAMQSIDEGYEVELNGREAELDSEIIMNTTGHNELPGKGAVLEDQAGNLFKVYDTKGEDYGPVLRLRVISKYAGDIP